MEFWLLAIAITVLACATLYYAALGRAVNAPGEGSATGAHHRLQLREIETDLASGRLSPAEAKAAKAELAREVLRLEGEDAGKAEGRQSRALLLAAPVLVAVLAFGAYVFLGQPTLPNKPLAGREDVAAQSIDLDLAVKRIEEQLARTPDDLKGWQVVAPVYMQLGRFADAAHAYRRVLDLSEPTADGETDLAEALIMGAEGVAGPDALALLKSAVSRDPANARAYYYLADDASRRADWAEAKAQWQALIALGKGDEPWMATARQGLAAAEAGLSGTPAPAATDPDQAAAIAAMVRGLADRLYAEGGSLEEWTRLVRSYLVLDQKPEAQKAYDAAKSAYPRLMERADLDALAREGGLK